MEIKENHSLKNFNTFGVNSKSKYFVEIKSEDDLIKLFKTDVYSNNKRLILGGGSNILLKSDFSGLVIYINIKGKNYQNQGDYVLASIKAGEIWHDTVLECTKNGYHGLENLALIPGKVGAAPVQNIGAYGVEQVEFVESVKGISLIDFGFRTLSPKECKFSYRDSIFKNELKDKFIITEVVYKLDKEFKKNFSYKDLSDRFANIENPDPMDVVKAVCEIRNSKLPDPEKIGNSGSFFKNPVIQKKLYDDIRREYPQFKGYNIGTGIKVSAGWLIEMCGLKGVKLPNTDAGIYDKHSLILVNNGNATGKEIYLLSEVIIKSVWKKFGITLEREVNVID